MAERSVSWDKTALQQFIAAIEYIAKDSLQNAEKVHSEIIQKIELLPARPEIYPPDKYKMYNDGSFRAFELHRLRVAYYIDVDIIRILRIRHTSLEPLPY
jgi:plasmid stabilization system protein ParE